MLSTDYLRGIYKKKKELITYSALTFLDKGISFALPLTILFFIQDRQSYNLIEVVYSYSAIVLTIAELGLTSYLFWGYKNSEDKVSFLKEGEFYFTFIIIVYALLALVGVTSIHFISRDKDLIMIFILVSVRALFMFYINFHSNVFRLKDSPSKIYFVSLLINILAIVTIFTFNYFGWGNSIMAVFLPCILFLLGVCLRYLWFEFKISRLLGIRAFMEKSIAFAWPIMLNALLMNFMNNYAKIYAFGNLPSEEMTQISFILRVSLIIQLTHLSFSSFYSKSIFMDSDKRFNTKIFVQYSLALLLSLALVVAILLITQIWFGGIIPTSLGGTSLLFLGYVFIWCCIAYLEIYFGVMNANRKILFYSIVSSVLYVVLLSTLGEISILKLGIIMVASALSNLILVIFGLTRLGVLPNLKSPN